MKKTLIYILACAVLLIIKNENSNAQLITPYTFGTLRARELGPATSSGRVTAIEALYMPQEVGKKD